MVVYISLHSLSVKISWGGLIVKSFEKNSMNTRCDDSRQVRCQLTEYYSVKFRRDTGLKRTAPVDIVIDTKTRFLSTENIDIGNRNGNGGASVGGITSEPLALTATFAYGSAIDIIISCQNGPTWKKTKLLTVATRLFLNHKKMYESKQKNIPKGDSTLKYRNNLNKHASGFTVENRIKSHYFENI